MAESKSKATSKASAGPGEVVAFFDVVGTDHVYDAGGKKRTSDVTRLRPAQAAGDYPGGAGLVFPAGVYELHVDRGAGLPVGTRLAVRLPVEVVAAGEAAGEGEDADEDDEDEGG